KLLNLYEMMIRIRKFEEEAGNLFEVGDIPGFLHLSIGQEASVAGACADLEKTDYITSTHRGHGHMIGKGGDVSKMMAELCARADGYCRGKGGSMHISSIDIGMLGANGMVGAGLPLATGAALAQKIQGADRVAMCFFGDGASNEGLFHESLNAASLWNLPVIFLCENNQYGVSTHQSRSMKVKDIAVRGTGYDMPSVIVDGNDVLAVYEAASLAIKRARQGQGPTLIECKTYKHRGHFEGDSGDYRPAAEVKEWLQKDPIKRFESYLIDNKIASSDEVEQIHEKVAAEIAVAIEFALAAPLLDVGETVVDVYTDIVEEGR
ncbi:MAG TPA: thiamine pyrophosphate-dependent dehydrogenase E1 component subunit alpha, partial [Syntrophomonas sp.]|nr:thiamine pyrophosphate-dependent dehydrogenase E1 component subunit alpha [Syntrophomonas sp.]